MYVYPLVGSGLASLGHWIIIWTMLWDYTGNWILLRIYGRCLAYTVITTTAGQMSIPHFIEYFSRILLHVVEWLRALVSFLSGTRI